MNKRTGLLLGALGLAVAAGAARAELAAVDPGPYTPATGGFPQWYQDENGLSLELCQSKALSPSGTPGAYLCTLLPEPGVAQPLSHRACRPARGGAVERERLRIVHGSFL